MPLTSEIYDEVFGIQPYDFVYYYFEATRFTIANTIFKENYSGMKGTAAYFRYINNIKINNCTF